MNNYNYVTDAINLKSYNLSEADKIIVLYSKDKGLLKGVAKGLKKPKSKLGARMDLLAANNLTMLKCKSIDRICQAQSLNMFKNTRKNIDKLVYSSYLTEIVTNFGVEDDPSSKEIYNLLYKGLNRIDAAHDKREILIAVIKFQLKMMLIEGFSLELDSCLCCGEQILAEDMFLSLPMGGVICKNCRKPLNVNLKLNYKIRDFLQAMLQFDFDYESNYDRKATEKVCQVCFNLLDDYIKVHSSKKQKTLKVLKELAT